MITSNTNNPWVDLPSEPPYIAPVDTSGLLKVGKRADGLRFDVIPDPYFGDINQAEIVVLPLNPGFEDADLLVNMQRDEYVTQNRLSLKHKSSPPFYVLSPELIYSGGYRWWMRIYKPLLQQGISADNLAHKMMSIQYLGYHSTTYLHLNTTLPSQLYSFDLVRQAILLKKTILIMRSEKLWLEAVPELIGYPYIKIRNPRNPVFSPVNLTQPVFDQVISKLRR
jgi:hypothetical protein